jgi:DNA-binding CsgD family transcriptional regulator
MPQNGNVPLSDRQLELLALVASGNTIAEAAGQIYVAEQSAYNLLSVARGRAGAKTIPHLVLIAVQHGWLVPDGEGLATPSAKLVSA